MIIVDAKIMISRETTKKNAQKLALLNISRPSTVQSTVAKHRFQQVFIGPVWQEKERQHPASDPCPVDTAHIVEVRTAEVERTSIEQDGTAGMINLPQPTAMTIVLPDLEQFTMLIDMPELEHALVCYDELLIHGINYE